MWGRAWRLLHGPRGPAALAVVALVLALPSVTQGPALDDHGFRRRLVVERGGPEAAFHFDTGGDGRLTCTARVARGELLCAARPKGVRACTPPALHERVTLPRLSPLAAFR